MKLYYSQVPNMGDILNEMITKDIFGVNITRSNSIFDADFTGIGSFLGAFYNNMSPKQVLKKHFLDLKNNQTVIWSSGFIEYPKSLEVPMKKNIVVSSVRGELTKKRIEKILNKKLDITTGDGGLLASELVKRVPKKYEIGVIPHYKEFNDNNFASMRGNSKFKFINLRDEPYQVVKEIAECNYILSSSLHGLIVADSFNIPNLRLVASSNLLGDGYKFDDYYSSFGVDSKFIDLNMKSGILSENEILDNYKITSKDVDKKKQEIYDAFMKYK